MSADLPQIHWASVLPRTHRIECMQVSESDLLEITAAITRSYDPSSNAAQKAAANTVLTQVSHLYILIQTSHTALQGLNACLLPLQKAAGLLFIALLWPRAG